MITDLPELFGNCNHSSSSSSSSPANKSKAFTGALLLGLGAAFGDAGLALSLGFAGSSFAGSSFASAGFFLSSVLPSLLGLVLLPFPSDLLLTFSLRSLTSFSLMSFGVASPNGL